MNKLKDTDLREALRRNYAETPQLPEGFMERMHEAVEQEESQPRRTRLYRLAAAITSIAAAILIAFLLWPASQDTTLTQPEQQPVVVEVSPRKPVPKEKVEAETTVSGTAETPQKAMPVSQTKRPQTRKVIAQATAIATTEEKVSPVIIDAKPDVVEELPQRGEPPIPSDRQALADIYLAEAALQVAYQRQAQAEAMRAYAASLEGEETPPAQPIIAF